MECENCHKEHDGSYGSGRFCSKRCRCSYNAKQVKHRQIPRKFKRSPYGTWKCERCNIIFETRRKLEDHNHEFHPIPKGSSWNKGKNKEIDFRIARASTTYKQHLKEGKVHIWTEGKHLSLYQKQQISKSMKKAHAEGRAHNIGECRWNNEPSWPEKWFMQVIENEFDDKNYEREMPFHRFSLDFAWKHKKCVIEIDGEQHYRDKAQKARDKEKDKLLKEEDWKELRLDWRWVCKHTKEAIKLAKEFVDLNQAFVDNEPLAQERAAP